MIREITAILVSWNDADEALEAAASLSSARARIPHGGVRASLVAVDNGWLTLKGEVRHQSETDAAFEAVRRLPGVGGITNEVKVISAGIDG